MEHFLQRMSTSVSASMEGEGADEKVLQSKTYKDLMKHVTVRSQLYQHRGASCSCRQLHQQHHLEICQYAMPTNDALARACCGVIESLAQLLVSTVHVAYPSSPSLSW